MFGGKYLAALLPHPTLPRHRGMPSWSYATLTECCPTIRNAGGSSPSFHLDKPRAHFGHSAFGSPHEYSRSAGHTALESLRAFRGLVARGRPAPDAAGQTRRPTEVPGSMRIPSRASAAPPRAAPRSPGPATIQDPDLTSDPRSGRIDARWGGVYPRCDKADPGGKALGFGGP
jgi:D-alanyl-D-alanine carboxypeptidase